MLATLLVLLVIFQVLVLGVATPKGYQLIYSWIFFAINYLIIILLCMIYTKNSFLKWSKWLIGLILFVANTTFFFYMGDVNLVVSKSQDQNEVILKEFNKMNTETVHLKRRGIIFGRETGSLMGSSSYKAIEEETYKIDWVSEDVAIVTYKVSEQGNLQQEFISRRSSTYSSYQYVAVGLMGRWYQKDNSDNYVQFDQGEIVYAKEGQLYYYTYEDTVQHGIFSIVVNGDDNKPSFSIVINADASYDEDGLIKKGGTITVSPITLDNIDGNIYERK